MKIIAVSDTHNFHKYLTSKGIGKLLPEGDLLIHSGDLTGTGRKDEVEEVLQWFKEIAPHYTHGIAFIAGNHDRSFDPKFNYLDNQRKKPDWLEEKLASLPSNVHYLENSGLTVEGLKIWGSPITPWFYGDRWAFNKHRGAEINDVWNTIPNDTNVLITHGPPAKIGDFIPSSREYVGCSDLLHRIQVILPKLVVFGHIHESYGMQTIDDTIYANASICDANYDPTNKPFVIQL